ncbi:MAG: hypothetical protein OEM02_10065, partial [Desulfobulbaceae bacterium]|nr:hypothetical protein [Desulfobulbaceae bacterium]
QDKIEIPQDTIDDKLDSFFGTEEEVTTPVTEDAQLTLEEEPVVAALADSDEEIGFREDDIEQDKIEIPQDTIDDKLDSFFGAEEEVTTPVTEEAQLTLEEEPVVAALADSDEEIGFREDDIEQDKIEIPQDTIDDKLDSFFGAEEDVTTPIMEEEAQLTLEEEPIIAAITPVDVNEKKEFGDVETKVKSIEPAEESIDDKLDSFFAPDQEDSQLIIPKETIAVSDEEPFVAAIAEELPSTVTDQYAENLLKTSTEVKESLQYSPQTDTFSKQLTQYIESQKNRTIEKGFEKQHNIFQNLGDQLQQLPLISETKKTELISKCVNLIDQLRNDPLPQTQKPILQLLESVITLLPHQKLTKLPSNTMELASYLYAHISSANEESHDQAKDTLLQAIEFYTQWQKQLFESLSKAIPSIPPAIDQDNDLNHQKISSEIRQGLNELRNTLHLEIDALRKEFSGSRR